MPSNKTYPTSISAITTNKEVLIEVECNAFSWDALVGVFHKVWIVAMQSIDTWYRHVLFIV